MKGVRFRSFQTNPRRKLKYSKLQAAQNMEWFGLRKFRAMKIRMRVSLVKGGEGVTCEKSFHLQSVSVT